jgi:transcriptional regulator with XRE-family HTH domain
MLGTAIRESRERNCLSREKLAEAADLHPNYLGCVERGEDNVSLDALVRIAAALKVPVRRLVAEI